MSQADGLRSFFANDRFVADMGVQIQEIADGCATCTLRLDSRHMNADHVAQGGALFTLADFTFAVAANSCGMGVVSLNSSISFLRAGREGSVLTAVARPISSGKRICVYQIDIRDDQNVLLATVNATGYRKQKEIAGK